MKKIIALTLAVLMLAAMMTGCANNTTTDSGSNDTKAPTQAETQSTQAPTQAATQATTQPQQNTQAAVGDILDAPEVTFDTSIEDLYIYYTYPGESEEEVLSMEIAIDQITDDSYIIYMSDGLMKLNEIVYEVTDSGIQKYCRDVFMDNFEADTALTQAELEDEVDSMLSLFSLFMLAGENFQNVKYQKTDDFAFSLTGDVYTYNIIENGEIGGQVWIDTTTGLLARLIDTDGVAQISAQEIKTSDIVIPSYK